MSEFYKFDYCRHPLITRFRDAATRDSPRCGVTLAQVAGPAYSYIQIVFGAVAIPLSIAATVIFVRALGKAREDHDYKWKSVLGDPGFQKILQIQICTLLLCLTALDPATTNDTFSYGGYVLIFVLSFVPLNLIIDFTTSWIVTLNELVSSNTPITALKYFKYAVLSIVFVCCLLRAILIFDRRYDSVMLGFLAGSTVIYFFGNLYFGLQVAKGFRAAMDESRSGHVNSQPHSTNKPQIRRLLFIVLGFSICGIVFGIFVIVALALRGYDDQEKLLTRNDVLIEFSILTGGILPLVFGDFMILMGYSQHLKCKSYSIFKTQMVPMMKTSSRNTDLKKQSSGTLGKA